MNHLIYFMGCSSSCLRDTRMSLFRRQSSGEIDARTQLERKLYIAKESPEPTFDLSECQLKQVPSGMFSICKVYRKEYLYLNNNNLSSLAHGGQLSDLFILRVLNLSFNKFTQLPSDFRYLVNLTELYIQQNSLQSLPENIHLLESLQILDVSNNNLRSLTPSLGKLINLQLLNAKGNKHLTQLCLELGQLTSLRTLEIDGEQFEFPPPEISTQTTEVIMRFLCSKMNIEYISTAVSVVDSVVEQPKSTVNPFAKQPYISWEEQEAAIMEQENKYHQAAKLQREKFLSTVLKDQNNLDTEIAKVQEMKEIERAKLINQIQQDEKDIECLVRNFIDSDSLKPEIIQQQLQHEKDEHDRLLEILKQNQDNIRKNDILKAMEAMVEENLSAQLMKKDYNDHVNNKKQNWLAQELESSEKLQILLRDKDQSRTVFIQQLLEDQDVQKAVVASLVEQVDARSWSLNQEISLISSHLAKLSVIEQEKKRLQVSYNFNELMYQRSQLVNLLDDLLKQKHKRRNQLVETMKEMDRHSDLSADYWLKNYQKIVESAPKSLLNLGKNLDPIFASYLVQGGVIHCLPFLVKFLFSEDSLSCITDGKLKDSGVTLSDDRDGILQAIKLYIEAKSNENHNAEFNTASAPALSQLDEHSLTGVVSVQSPDSLVAGAECIICMDSRCEIVFVPCGHLCVCTKCSEENIEICPMCRCHIEKKMKVIIA